MKIIDRIQATAWVLVLLLLVNCEGEQETSAPGQVVFSFSAASVPSLTHTQNTPAYVSFVLRRPDGDRISIRRNLTELSGSYVTEPEQLIPGNYALEQFFILDSEEKSIYASPVEGSELADLVEHPLPLEFSVASDHTTNVVPEVLETENQTAEGFGYVTLSFHVVDVIAFRIPAIENTAITKISYELTQGATTIASEITTSGRLVTLHDERLREGEWQARVWVWTAANTCFKEVYRYQGAFTFSGALQQLPVVADSRWMRFYHTQKKVGERTADFFIGADPRTNFRLELNIPGAGGVYGYFDRTYWDANGEQLCDSEYMEIYGSGSFAQGVMNDSPGCNETTPDEIDSFVSFHFLSGTDNSYYQYYFLWKVLSTGEIIPVCDCGSCK